MFWGLHRLRIAVILFQRAKEGFEAEEPDSYFDFQVEAFLTPRLANIRAHSFTDGEGKERMPSD